MVDVNTSFRPDHIDPLPASEPVQLPNEITPYDDSIVIKRTTLYLLLFAFSLFLGGYLMGWLMGSSSGGTVQAVRAAVRESMSTIIAALPSSTGSAAVAQAQPQQPPTQDPPIRYKVEEAGNPALGPQNAPITIIEFSDFQCPFCKSFHDQTFSRLQKKYEGKIRFVYRDFPLSEIHPLAQGAAEAADCANEQGKFWEYHDMLFQYQPQLEATALMAYANKLNLDMKVFQACLESHKYKSEVEGDYAMAIGLGLTGTPTFFVNGRILVGAQPLEAFSAYIDAELATAGSPATAIPTKAS